MKKKLLMSLLISGLIMGLVTPSILKANEQNKINEDEIVEAEEQSEDESNKEKTEQANRKTDTIQSQEQSTKEVKSNLQTRAGALVPDQTTLGQAFPDEAFRIFVAETVLGKTSGTYTGDTTLTSSDITLITNTVGINVSNKGISSLEGLKYFTNLKHLFASNNELTGSMDVSDMTSLLDVYLDGNDLTEVIASHLPSLREVRVNGNDLTDLDITNSPTLKTIYASSNPRLSEIDFTGLISVTNLQVSYCNISTLDVSMMDSLQTLNIQYNPITSVEVSDLAKGTITSIMYNYTNITDFDFTGFNSIVSLNATKNSFDLSKLNASNITSFIISPYYSEAQQSYKSHLRVLNSGSLISYNGNGQFFEILPSSVANYLLYVSYGNSGDTMAVGSPVILQEGALVDFYGNIILGNSLSNLVDGELLLEDGNKILHGEATYIISGNNSKLVNGKLIIGDKVIIKENVGSESGVNDGKTTTIEIPAGETAEVDMSSANPACDVPSGSIVTHDDGSKTYMVDEGSIYTDESIENAGVSLTVPSDKVSEIATGGDEVTFPAGTVINDGSTTNTYPGNIIYNKNDNSVKYMPIDGLFNDDGTLKDGVTQEDITNSQDFVTGMNDSTLKTELQEKVKDAQSQFNEREAQKAVDDLFDGDKIKDEVTQENINDAQDLVNKVTDEDKKKELQDKLDEAQKQLEERDFIILEKFATFTGEGTVYTKIDAPVEKFSKVYVDGKELDASNYEVTSGSTVITLNEIYLKSLANKTYNVEVEFASGARVSVPLTVDVKTTTDPTKPVEPTDPTKPTDPTVSKPSVDGKPSVAGGTTVSGNNAVNTGDETNTMMLYAMLAISLLGLIVVIKRRKETE